MTHPSLKNYGFALALGIGFVIAPSFLSLSTVQAQEWRYQQQRRIEQQRREELRRQRQMERQQRQQQRGVYGRNDPYYGQVDESGNIDRNQNGVDDRWENDPRYRNGNGGYYGNDDRYYGNKGYNNAEVQKGFRDGLDRGQKDAQTNRIADPNNSSHFRKGNQAYRAGFSRGYSQGFRQYANARRW